MARGLREVDLPVGEYLPRTGCTGGGVGSCLRVVGEDGVYSEIEGDDGAELLGWMFIQRWTGGTRQGRGEDSNTAVHSTQEVLSAPERCTHWLEVVAGRECEQR